MVNLEEISPIVFGAGAFNWEYDKEPDLVDVPELLKYALDNGFNAFDTAACYGPSESILGDALVQIGADPKYSRDKYFLTSKAGRWEDDTFDYSEFAIRHSVSRSLERLHTSYLDLLIIHDVEYVPVEEALNALVTATALKKEGKVRNIGISGYPLSVLSLVQESARLKLHLALDALLSYCNLTLQNRLLLIYAPQFKKHGVRVVFNASPLSMSLLRSRMTHSFHPARSGLRRTADKIAQSLNDRGIELADVASQYSFANWNGCGPTVIGIRTKEQVDAAIRNREVALTNPQKELWDQIIRDFGDYHNYTWPSP